MPMSRASATTETMMCRTAYSPITMPSSPSITFHTRIPPDSSAAKALMNEKMPDTMIWMPNRTARTTTVGPGQATAHIPAATMRMPKNSSQPQCRPIRPSWSPMSLDRGVVMGASQLPRCTGHMFHGQLGSSRCPCPAGPRFAHPAARPAPVARRVIERPAGRGGSERVGGPGLLARGLAESAEQPGDEVDGAGDDDHAEHIGQDGVGKHGAPQ